MVDNENSPDGLHHFRPDQHPFLANLRKSQERFVQPVGSISAYINSDVYVGFYDINTGKAYNTARIVFYKGNLLISFSPIGDAFGIYSYFDLPAPVAPISVTNPWRYCSDTIAKLSYKMDGRVSFSEDSKVFGDRLKGTGIALSTEEGRIADVHVTQADAMEELVNPDLRKKYCYITFVADFSSESNLIVTFDWHSVARLNKSRKDSRAARLTWSCVRAKLNPHWSPLSVQHPMQRTL